MAFEKIESARWVRVKFCADKIFELRETICSKFVSDYGITKASKKIYRKIKSLRRVFISGRLTIKKLTRKKNKENECGMFILESEKQVGRKIKSSTESPIIISIFLIRFWIISRSVNEVDEVV